MTETARTLEELAARLRAEGYTLDDATLAEVWRVLPAVEAMRARLRRRFAWADEPAHVFSTHPRR